MSLVLIWPSTVIRSKERVDGLAQSAARRPRRSASVWTKQSIVAKPGWIIPAPLAWAERVTPSQRTVQRFGQASVVMIASENSLAAVGADRGRARRMPSRTSSIGSASPIFPVAAIATADGSRSSSSAAALWIAIASRIPCSPVAALALPALTAAARIAPRSQLSRQTRTGAAAAALRVSSSAESTARSADDQPASVLPLSFSPQATAPAAKPGRELGGVSSSTPPGARPSASGRRPRVSAHRQPLRLRRVPSIRLRFWTPWPDAPFQRLSIAEKASTRPRSSTVT